MIAAKKGTTTRWGYLLAHGVMIINLVGGLLSMPASANTLATLAF
jgi:cytochrome c biogenesis protein ResB